MSLNFLKDLIQGINTNKGTVNCGHCAFRLDTYLAHGRNLNLGPVPVESAQLYTRNFYKAQKTVVKTSSDPRILDKCAPIPSDYRIICDLNDASTEYVIDLTEGSKPNNEVRFKRSSDIEIAETLKQLSRRKQDGSAYGFIVLTHLNNITKGHIINFYVDNYDQVYFIDAQLQTVSQSLNMTGYRPEIFYIASRPPEGYIIKNENSAMNVKEEKDNDTIASDVASLEELYQQHLRDIQLDDRNAITWYQLGICYYEGNGTQPNPQEAFKCFQNSLHYDNQDSDTWVYLGLCYLDGHGIQENLSKAYACFLRASKLNQEDFNAWINLEACYREGLGTEPNLDKAFDCFQMAVRCDPKETFNYYEEAAKLNSKDASVWLYLGICFRDGLGILSNPKEASKCLHTALNLNAQDASVWHNLAIHCRKLNLFVKSLECSLKAYKLNNQKYSSCMIESYKLLPESVRMNIDQQIKKYRIVNSKPAGMTQTPSVHPVASMPPPALPVRQPALPVLQPAAPLRQPAPPVRQPAPPVRQPAAPVRLPASAPLPAATMRPSVPPVRTTAPAPPATPVRPAHWEPPTSLVPAVRFSQSNFNDNTNTNLIRLLEATNRENAALQKLLIAKDEKIRALEKLLSEQEFQGKDQELAQANLQTETSISSSSYTFRARN